MTQATITVAYGDGIGPEVMEAALMVMREAGAELTVETIEVGSRVYKMGGTQGILPYAWESLHRTRVLLKAPTGQPTKEDQKDVSLALRELLQLAPIPGSEGTGWKSEHFAMFEPTHDIRAEQKGKDNADPSEMIRVSALMLEHIGQRDVAARIRMALERTLQEGVHTKDRFVKGESAEKATTREFTQAVMQRLWAKAAAAAS